MADHFQTLAVRRDDEAVAEVVLLAPAGGKGPLMGPAFWDELPRLFAALGQDPALRAIVLRSDTDHFSYGLDLLAMAPSLQPALRPGPEGQRIIGELGRAMQAGFTAIADCPKPVIAAVGGWCIGGGLEMIAACDLRLCSADARFALREVKVGMVADLGGLQRLPHLLGEGLLRELALTGDPIDAARAERIGLVNAVHADGAALHAAALDLARRIAANPPRVLAGIKQVLNARTAATVTASLDQALGLNTTLMQSEDFREALSAFFEKRPPVYRGR